MNGETKSGHLTHQLGRPHAWKDSIAGQPYRETVSLTTANMCQGDRGEVSTSALGAHVLINGNCPDVPSDVRCDDAACRERTHGRSAVR